MTDRVLRGQPLIEIDGAPKYLHGANYPARKYAEFGATKWGDGERIVYHTSDIDFDFEKMARQGVTVARWFLFTDGRNGIEYDDKGNISGLSPKVFQDMDAALEIARNHHIRVVFSLLDYLVQLEIRGREGHPNIVGTGQGRKDFIEKILRPLLYRYGTDDTIFAWEVMNEPEWVIAEMQPKPKKEGLLKPLKLNDFAEFTRAVVREVSEQGNQLVTIGSARVKFLKRWDDLNLGIHFLQVHFYYDHKCPDDEVDIFGQSASSLGLSLPVIIGEAPGINDRHDPPVSNTQFYEWSLNSGFAGLWMWAHKKDEPPEDPQELKRFIPRAPYDFDEMEDFARKHPEFANPAARPRGIIGEFFQRRRERKLFVRAVEDESRRRALDRTLKEIADERAEREARLNDLQRRAWDSLMGRLRGSSRGANRYGVSKGFSTGSGPVTSRTGGISSPSSTQRLGSSVLAGLRPSGDKFGQTPGYKPYQDYTRSLVTRGQSLGGSIDFMRGQDAADRERRRRSELSSKPAYVGSVGPSASSGGYRSSIPGSYGTIRSGSGDGAGWDRFANTIQSLPSSDPGYFPKNSDAYVNGGWFNLTTGEHRSGPVGMPDVPISERSRSPEFGGR